MKFQASRNNKHQKKTKSSGQSPTTKTLHKKYLLVQAVMAKRQNQCSFFITDVTFCENIAIDGKSYCSECYRKVYVCTSKQERRLRLLEALLESSLSPEKERNSMVLQE
jgi:hypothetical protein